MSVACPSVLHERHDSSKFKETPSEDPALEFDTEGGWDITRPRYMRRPPTVYSLSFTDLSDLEKTQIENLYKNTRGGSDIITDWIHPVTDEAKDVRFKKGSIPQFQYRGRGGNHRWDVTSVEIEEI